MKYRKKPVVIEAIAAMKLGEALTQLETAQATIAEMREALDYSKKVQEFAKSVQTGAQDRELARMEKILWDKTVTALAHPANQDALHEALAKECERLAKKSEQGMLLCNELIEEAAAHRARKEWK